MRLGYALAPCALLPQDTLGRCLRRGQVAGMRLLMFTGVFTEAEVAAEETSLNAESAWQRKAVAGGPQTVASSS